MNPSGLARAFYFVLRNLNTASILLLVIGLFKLFIQSWLNFGGQYMSKKSSISFSFLQPSGVNVVKVKSVISLVSVVVSPFSPLILLVWVFSFS